MTTTGQKVQHVLQARQDRDHTCHWPGCERQVKPAMWGCLKHWRMLPDSLRKRIWAAYRIGQEVDGRPSPAYISISHEVQGWIIANHGNPQGDLPLD